MKASEFKGKSYIDTLPKSLKIKRFIWNIIWLLLFNPTPRWALNSWRIFLLKLFGANIQEGSRILPSCKIWAPWNLTLGEYTVLGDYVDCYNVDKIIIGDRVTISQRTFLCTASHDITSLRLPLIHKPIVIENFAWICSECFIYPGCIIKEGSVIAARSVLIKESNSWSVYAGNPAKEIKKRIIKKEA
jgi:putative colanic acid biosynthesis acetyltransferase WcaF